MVFYGFIYIHDIPYAIAKKRNHPHKEAIHVACWLSLFTLHAIWPLVYIWSVFKPLPVRVSIVSQKTDEADYTPRPIRVSLLSAETITTEDTQQELQRLREQVKALESAHSKSKIEMPS